MTEEQESVGERQALTYSKSGVDLGTASLIAEIAPRLSKKTYGPRVIDFPQGFAGLFSLDYGDQLFARNYRRPVLVACADGVGTKLEIAFRMGQHNTVGIDLVAMNVNDLITVGAEPLFFLDYIAAGKVEPGVFRELLEGMIEGCQQAECALIGGETAEMPDFYRPGEYDLAGFAVGIVERKKILDGSRVSPGDVLIGLASSGLHSNGFSLVRQVFFKDNKFKLTQQMPDLGCALGEELLRPTRIYARTIRRLLAGYKIKKMIRAIAHITGGGLPGNVERILPKGCRASITRGSWDVPPVFRLVQELGHVAEEEMYRVFNMGIGMVLAVSPASQNAVLGRLAAMGQLARVIGKVGRGTRGVKLS